MNTLPGLPDTLKGAHIISTLPRTKIKVSADMLPMLVTVLPAQIIGSEQCGGGVVCLVVEGPQLPKSEYCTVHVKRTGAVKSEVEIVAVNA